MTNEIKPKCNHDFSDYAYCEKCGELESNHLIDTLIAENARLKKRIRELELSDKCLGELAQTDI